MNRSLLRLSAVALFAAAATASADYCFPSANPPGNMKTSDVKQFVTLIWDDNGYSGKKFTQYEAAPGASYAASSWIGGKINEGGWNGDKPNTLNLQEGDMGMSWAAQTLAGVRVPTESPYDAAVGYSTGAKVLYHDTIWTAATYNQGVTPEVYTGTEWKTHWDVVSVVDHSRTRANPDGTPIKFTFNVISGLIIPVWPTAWTSRESKFGYWVPTTLDYPDGQVLHTKIAISWGREMQILASQGGTEFQANYILNSYKEAADVGHEIGNHTVDHMESNSALSKSSTDYMLDGKDSQQNDVMPWGETIDEAALYGQKPGASAQTMGWLINAGKIISKASWRSAIDIGEAQLDEYMDISVAKGNCFSFRAPRLEVNSNMFFALKEAGYQYDCGLEEGYEEYVDGTNFVWPYTTDNGSPNVFTQKINGERLFIDSMPVGFWELPVNCVIVPTALRPGIYTKYHQISAGAGEAWANDAAQAALDSVEWCYGPNGGKITGFDFNIFILWGLSKSEFIETMKYNLDLRLAGNKAPLQYGCHTDYYTPIYDNATLLNDFNKNSYGLVVSKGWNTWVDRKEAVTEFVDYAVSKDAYVVSGHELVEQLKSYMTADAAAVGSTQTQLSTTPWEFYANAGSTGPASFTGDITNAAITMAGGTDEDCGYSYYTTPGTFTGIDHISLTYKTTNPLIVKLVGAADKTWEVLLNNVGPETQSGLIPINAFHAADKSPVPSEEIMGIEIQVVNMDSTNKAATFSVSNIRTYSGAPVSLNPHVKGAVSSLALGAVNASGLSFTAPRAGSYDVRVYSLNGKLVQSFNREMGIGTHRVEFANRLASSMYLVKINGAGKSLSQKAMVR